MRIITETQSPPNIAVFSAATIDQAIKQADEALKHDRIQGCVWVRPEFYKTQYTVEDLSPTTKLSSSQQTDSIWGEAIEGKIQFKKGELIAGSSALELDAKIIAKYSLRTELSLLFSMKTCAGMPHIESTNCSPPEGQQKNENFPFNGLPIRLIQTLKGDGTETHDPDDITQSVYIGLQHLEPIQRSELADGWYVSKGDTLFLTTQTWGKTKALVHNGAIVEASTQEQARITRTIDLNFLS